MEKRNIYKGAEIKNLPDKYQPIWQECLKLFPQGRPGDMEHAKQTVEFILNYKGSLKLNLDILIPVAMIHDIGHLAILPEHLKYVTGPEKIINGKLVHMLTGAKIAHDILIKLSYNPKLTKEIVDIISVHDSDQLTGIDPDKAYDSENKKIFHDIDVLDRFNDKRLKKYSEMFSDKDYIKGILDESLKVFFHDEFKNMAIEKMKTINL